MPVARHLVRSDPGRETSSPWTPRRPSLFDLAPGGVYRAGRSPGRRWALTPPFHRRRDRSRGCVLSVALSFGSPRLGVTQRPALWSPDFPQAASRPRPSDRLACRVYPWPPRLFHAGRHRHLGPVCWLSQPTKARCASLGGGGPFGSVGVRTSVLIDALQGPMYGSRHPSGAKW